MSILIAYAGNNNTTEKCAKILNSKLPDSHIVNLIKVKVNISDYDTIVIGSCIRFNSIHSSVIELIKENMNLLMNKNTAIFLCCGFPEKANQYILHNFPKKLLNNSVSIHCFGGRLKVKPYRLYDNLVMKTVKKNFKIENRNFTEIDYDSIQDMADEIMKLNKDM